MSESIGTLFNRRYRLDGELGRGGMGVVYRAHDTLLGRDVALKVLAQAGLGSEGRTRLLREAQSAAQLNHPNVVAIYDAGEVKGSPFIVMEVVAGQSLHERPPQSLDELLKIAGQVCAALDHAHAHGIIHRDLKPENVIVTPEGSVKLTDFGLARSVASRLTAEGALVGTVFYLAPELALGEALDGRADLYALGVVLYEFAAGRLPFTAEDPVAIISQHLYAPVVPPSTYNAAIPPALDALIVRLLAKRPEERPATAAEVQQALRDLADGVTPPGPEPAPLDRLARGQLVGREREFAAARDWWLRAVAGGEERVLLISGEAGGGKTPLAREVTALAEVARARVLTSACYAEGSAAYAPVAQLIRDGLDLGVELPPPVLADLVAIAPELRARYPDLPANPSYDPAADRQRLHESAVTLCAALAQARPLLLVVENAQWADAGSLYLLRYLAHRSRTLCRPILLLLTYREAEVDPAGALPDVLLYLERERLALRIPLARYDREQTRALLEALFQQEVPAAFLDAVFHATAGSMFFVEEVCKALVEAGTIRREAGRWTIPESMAGLQVPASVRLAVQSRVARLDELAQEVLRLAAVLGREFDFETLQRAAGLDEEALVTALEAAEKAQVLVEVPRPGQEALAFTHALAQAVLRESVTGLRRRRLHRRAAGAIAAVRPDDYAALAYHYEQAGDPAAAQGYYRRAGDQALAAYANEEAVRFYRAALAQEAAAPDRAGLLDRLGEALHRTGRFSEAVQRWREAIPLRVAEGDMDAVAHLYAWVARTALDDVPQAQALCQEAWAIMPPDSATPGMVELLHAAGLAHHSAGQLGEALPLYERALALAENLGQVELQAEVLTSLGSLPNQPRAARQGYHLQAIALAEGADRPRAAARAHRALGFLLRNWAEFSPAREHFRRSREWSRQMGIAYFEPDILESEMSIALFLGDGATLEAGIVMMEEWLARAPEPEGWALWPDYIRGCLAAMRGGFEEAVRFLQAAGEGARRRENLSWLAIYGSQIAVVFWMMGRPAEAAAAAEEGLAAAERFRRKPGLFQRWVAALAYSALGREAAARQQLVLGREEWGVEVGPVNQTIQAWCEACVAGAAGRWTEALEHGAQALQGAAETGITFYHMMFLLDMARLYLGRGEAGDRERAMEVYRQAQAEAEALGNPDFVRAYVAGTGAPLKGLEKG